MSTRTVSRKNRKLKPRTHSIYCVHCGLSEAYCNDINQLSFSRRRHTFARRTIDEQRAFDQLSGREKWFFRQERIKEILGVSERTYVHPHTLAPAG